MHKLSPKRKAWILALAIFSTILTFFVMTASTGTLVRSKISFVHNGKLAEPAWQYRGNRTIKFREIELESSIKIRRGFPEHLRLSAAEIYFEAFERKIGWLLGGRQKGIAYIAKVVDPDFAFVP